MAKASKSLKVEILDKSTPFNGFFQVDSYHLRHQKFDGSWSEPMHREVFERGNSAGILLYDPERDSVALVEQFRAAAYAAGRNPWLVEVVAGIIDPAESAESVARREAVEEAGCEITDLIPIGSYILSPGACSETLTLFCGRIDSKGVGGIHGLDHEHEDIRALVLTRDEALAMLADGSIDNASTVLALQWLSLNHESLRARWSE